MERDINSQVYGALTKLLAQMSSATPNQLRNLIQAREKFRAAEVEKSKKVDGISSSDFGYEDWHSRLSAQLADWNKLTSADERWAEIRPRLTPSSDLNQVEAWTGARDAALKSRLDRFAVWSSWVDDAPAMQGYSRQEWGKAWFAWEHAWAISTLQSMTTSPGWDDAWSEEWDDAWDQAWATIIALLPETSQFYNSWTENRKNAWLSSWQSVFGSPTFSPQKLSVMKDYEWRESRAIEVLGSYEIKTAGSFMISTHRQLIDGWLYANSAKLLFIADSSLMHVVQEPSLLLDDQTLLLPITPRPIKMTAPFYALNGIINLGEGLEFAGAKKPMKGIARLFT